MLRTASIVLLLSLLHSHPNFVLADGWMRMSSNVGGPNDYVFHPDKDIVYAEGDGLFRSTNGGQSWQNTGYNAWPLRIDPFRPDSLYSIGSSVLVSYNQGTTWTAIGTHVFGFTDSNANFATDFEFHTTRAGVIYAVSNGQFYKSSDYGKQWTKTVLPESESVSQVEVDPTNGDHIYLIGLRLFFQSTDAGQSFTSIPHSMGSEYRPPQLYLDYRNPKKFYAIQNFHFFRSIDEGKTWQDFECGCAADKIIIDPHHANTLFIVDSLYYKALRSNDDGQTWNRLRGLPPSVYALGVHPKKTGYILVSSTNGVYRSLDDSKTWKLFRGVYPFSPERIIAVPTVEGRMVALRLNQLYISNDSGKNWRRINIKNYVIDLQIHPQQNNLLVAVGSGGVSISKNGGLTWNETNGPSGSQVQLDPKNPNTFYVITKYSSTVADSEDGRITKTTDQGRSWKFVDSGFDQGEVRTIGIDPTNTSKLYAGTVQDSFYSSNNSGESWQRISDSPEGLSSIFVHPKKPSILIANGGRFRSVDSGLDWNLSLSSDTRRVEIDPYNSSILYSAGYDGLFVSTNFGGRWNYFDNRGLTTQGHNYALDIISNPWRPGDLFASADGIFSNSRSEGNPYITEVSPNPAKVGQTIVIRGKGFGLVKGKVKFAGQLATIVTSWSDQKIVAIVPAADPGPLSVINNSGLSITFGFLILPELNVALPGSGPSEGGKRIHFNVPSASIGYILFGNNLAKSMLQIRISESRALISCIAPPGKGNVKVRMINEYGETELGNFTYE